MTQGLTPSQTIGPFYFGTVVKGYRADLAPSGVAGERIELALTLHDAEGAIVPDGMFEIWQANSHGRYNHPEDRRNLPLDAGFEGYGRASAALPSAPTTSATSWANAATRTRWVNHGAGGNFSSSCLASDFITGSAFRPSADNDPEAPPNCRT